MKPLLFSIFVFLLFSGCKVGPNYSPPVVEMPCEYWEDKPDQTFFVDDDDLIQWWSRFNDPFLNELIEIALVQNFDYLIAIEKVSQARAQYWIQFTQMLPEFDATAISSRSKFSQSFASQAASAALISPIDNFYQVGLDAIWELDIWGKYRRAAQAALDSWEATEDERWGVKLTLISEVVNIYTAICSYQRLKEITEQVVQVDKDALSLIESKFEAGLSDEQDFLAAQTSLAADEAQLASVQAALKEYIYSLAILLGEFPESLVEDFLVVRPIPTAEGQVPVDLPSNLLRRRPDIQAAERQLAAATEEIGVAVADLFPSISLTGSSSSFASNPLQGANVGFSTDRLHRLFEPKSLIWGFGAFLTQPVLDFGKRISAVDVQIALKRQAYYAYLNAVVSAVEEAEVTLEVFFNEEVREKELSKAVENNFKTLNLTEDLYQAGLVDYLQLLQVKETWFSSVITLTQSQQALTTDLIAIYKALGGQW